MTREYAEAKLQQILDGLKKKLPDVDVDQVLQPDEELKEMVKDMERFPSTKDNYGAYMGVIGKDGMKAILCWRAGGNPVGIVTALYLNHGVTIP